MTQLLEVLGLAIASFLSTSLDNFVLLIGFFADEEYPRGQIVTGYVAAITLVVLGAFLAAEAVELVPASFLGYLGLVPVTLGLLGIYRLFRTAPSGGPEAVPRPTKGFVPVLAVMLANSGDTLGVFIPVFADTAESLELPILLTTGVCALGSAAVARWIATRSGYAGSIQRVARVVLPFLLVAIGGYILLNTGTDAL